MRLPSSELLTVGLTMEIKHVTVKYLDSFKTADAQHAHIYFKLRLTRDGPPHIEQWGMSLKPLAAVKGQQPAIKAAVRDQISCLTINTGETLEEVYRAFDAFCEENDIEVSSAGSQPAHPDHPPQ